MYVSFWQARWSWKRGLQRCKKGTFSRLHFMMGGWKKPWHKMNKRVLKWRLHDLQPKPSQILIKQELVMSFLWTPLEILVLVNILRTSYNSLWTSHKLLMNFSQTPYELFINILTSLPSYGHFNHKAAKSKSPLQICNKLPYAKEQFITIFD